MSDDGPVAALIVAAGESRRMGKPKALLDWQGKPLLQHQLDELNAAGCDPVVVVLGHEAITIEDAIRCADPCHVVINTRYMTGRASSLRAGAAAMPAGTAAVVICGVDTPCAATTVRRLVEQWRAVAERIVVPRFQGHNGHPALFDGALLPELRLVEEQNEGLRAVRRAHADSTRFVDVDDPWVALNLNTPEAYAAAKSNTSP
jgi:molybdenum cofactor cytidylyltransferase